MSNGKAVVIGAGVGGLAASIRLAARGWDVDVLEKNEGPGGKLTAFEKDGYLFDAGPSLFTQPANLRELFDLAGKNIGDYFRYRSVPVSNQYFFENGKRVQAYADAERLAQEMERELGEDPEAVVSYMKRSARLYDRIGTVFLDYSLHRSSTWLNNRILSALSVLRPSDLWQTLNSYNQIRFRTPEAVQIFNRFATYNGSSPFRTPAMLSMIPHLEINEGTFYPEGGMISITRSLHKLAGDLGVRFHFNTPTDRITVDSGRVSGVESGGRIWKADAVISNADVYYTYLRLLGDEAAAKHVLRQERSSSAVIFYWGIGREFPQLGLHNIFFTRDYPGEFDGLFRTGKLSDDPTIYVNITSKMEAGQAPAGKENWFVMVNAPADRGQDWPALRSVLREHVLNKLSRMLGADVRSAIETEETLDPGLIQHKTSSYMGSLYGTSSNSVFSAFLRHPNARNAVRGLYFCGGSVHPGGGIPLCLKSARIATELLFEDVASKKH